MTEFQIIYRGDATLKGFDMAVIGESMMGFNALLKDFYKVCGLEGELQVKTTSVKQGSVIIDGLLIADITNNFIENPELFLNALKQIDLTLWHQLNAYMSAFENTEKSINDFFLGRQFTSDAVSATIASMPGLLLAWWLDKKSNDKTTASVSKIEQKIDGLAKRKRFDKALKPLQENGYDSITYVSKSASNTRQVTISDTDLSKILPEEDKILPNYQNGDRFNTTGTIKSLSFARGERVGIAFHDAKFGNRIYPAFPDDGQTTASFRNLYGEDVMGEFEVHRKSLYKVPEFKIIALDKLQGELDTGESE